MIANVLLWSSEKALKLQTTVANNNALSAGIVNGKEFNNSLGLFNYLKDENQQLILLVDMYGHELSFKQNNLLLNYNLTSGLYIAKVKDINGKVNTLKVVIVN